jgi:hypothetical protein
LVGRDGVVWFAHPAANHRSWRILVETLYRRDGIAVPVFERNRDDWGEDVFVDAIDVAEEVLESTRLVQEWADGGEGPARFVPLERATGAGWRDHLEITLFAFLNETTRDDIDEETRDWQAIERIQEAAASTARELVASEEDVHWTAFDSVIESFIVYPSVDVVAAYERITAAPDEGWIHAEDDEGWPVSSWRRPGLPGAVFLAKGINNAEVTCRSYASPQRHSPPRQIKTRE